MYEEKIYETFKSIGTLPEDWSPVGYEKPDIKTLTDDRVENLLKGTETVNFALPDGYLKSTTMYTSKQCPEGMLPCELCGHPIKNLYAIKNDSKKIWIIVGSECVQNYVMAREKQKFIKDLALEYYIDLFTRYMDAVFACAKTPAGKYIFIHDYAKVKNNVKKILNKPTIFKLKEALRHYKGYNEYLKGTEYEKY